MNPEIRRKIEERMRLWNEDWWMASSFFGRRGGAVSGARRSAKAKALRTERRKQEALGIR